MSETFGKYKLIEKIAQGGMAEVFLATRAGEIGGFTRQVAIKRVFPHLVDQEEIIAMFIDEARIAARLQHPNIVQLYDLGVVDSSFFIAMEYVKGIDLRRLCELGVKKGNFLSRHLAAHLVAEAAAGLHYAHTRDDEEGHPMKIVHRDVSPQNILISVDGAVKICDFGIARAESRLSHTRAGEFKGKFSYMSPEQFGRGELDHRSDIFTLGIVLYEITVATRLFRSRTEYETMRRVMEGDFKRPSEVRPDFSPLLERIILKALAVDQEERYQSAEALQRDLEDWLYEERARVGHRQLAEYLKAIWDEEFLRAQVKPPADFQGLKSLEKRVEALQSERVSSLEGRGRKASSKRPDPTMELMQSELEILTVDKEESEESDATELLTFREEELELAEGGLSPGTAQGVEIRRITPEEAELRRKRKLVPADSIDATLVDVREAAIREVTNEITAPLGEEEINEVTLDSLDEEVETDDFEVDGLTNAWGEEPLEKEEQKLPSPSEPEREFDGLSLPEQDETKERLKQGREATQPWEGGAREIDFQQERLPQSQVAKSESDLSYHGRERSPQSPSVDSLIGALPDLSPGGRRLSRVEKKEERLMRPDPSPTDALPRVRVPQNSTGQRTLLQRVTMVGVSALVAIVVGVLIVNLWSASSSRAGEQAALSEETQQSVSLMVGEERQVVLVETEPPGAFMVINGVLQRERTPYEVELVPGRENEILLGRQNYRHHRVLLRTEDIDSVVKIGLERTLVTDTARLDLNSTPPGAKVFLNGEEVGITPLRMENVNANEITHVQYELEGYQPHVALLHLRSQSRNRIDARLVERGRDEVYGRYHTGPRGSRVHIGGEFLATTPFEQIHSHGEWLSIEIEGHLRETMTHALRLDQIGSFEFATLLEEADREMGQVSLALEFDGAIYLAGRAFGTGPLEEVELPVGSQTLVIETLEGRRIRGEILVESSHHRSYRVELTDGELQIEEL